MARKSRAWSEGDVEQLFLSLINDYKDLTVYESGFRYKMKERDSNGKIPDIVGVFVDGTKLIVEVKDLVSKEPEGISQLKGYMNTSLAAGEKALGVFVAAESRTKLYMKALYTTTTGEITEVEPDKNKSRLTVITKAFKAMQYEHRVKELVIIDVENDIKKDIALLHEHVRNYGKVSANEKVILLNAIMIALNSLDFINHLEQDIEDKCFSKRIHTATFSQIGLVSNDEVQTAIKSAISFLDVTGHPMNDSTIIPKALLSHHKHIKPSWDGVEVTHLSFSKFICNFIWFDIVKPLKVKYKDSKIDISSKFYNEFLKYTKSDGKDLGIVLTPTHIADLMIDLLDLKPDSRVLDICTGTGAFLISALKKKVSLVLTEEDEKEAHKGLIGVEMQPHMYVLAFANMLFNGGNLNHLFYGSCYEEVITRKIAQVSPTCAVLNPPYSMYKNSSCETTLHEWGFTQHALELVEKGGKVAVIVPTRCGIHNEAINNQFKQAIMESHRLDMIIQCNDQLFYPTGVTTNIYVFTAKIPHKENKGHITFTATFKDDGYEIKRKGRVMTGDYAGLKSELLKNIDEMKTTSKSNLVKLDETSEWDYTMANICPALNNNDFINTLKSYYHAN